jgi:ABC-type Mn2+/Zn2+ transport system ATPase subunit
MSMNHKDGLALQARHLDIGYEADRVVAEINVELGRGQWLALVGVNGSGKSTLLKTIVGLQPPLKGVLDVLGRPPAQATRRIAYLSQFQASGFVLPLRAMDVVRMGRFPAHGLVGRMTQEDNNLVYTAMQAMGVEKQADEPLRALSGGQQQRVYLAQALARRADILVLDEPAAGLDAAGREIYSQAMRAELDRGASIITATHDIQEAMDCDQVMLLARRVVASGPGREVLTPEALLEAFGIVLMGKDHQFSMAVVEREPIHGLSDKSHGA